MNSSKKLTVSSLVMKMQLEPEIWDSLIEICSRESMNLDNLCKVISEAEAETTEEKLTNFALQYFREASTDAGHEIAGHGDSNPETLCNQLTGSGRNFH